TTLHEMVLQTAALHENKPAVCFDECRKGAPIWYTYRDVTDLAKELTDFLQKHCHLESSCEIGLYCAPGIHLPSWILGILQAPAAYSPIDPEAPSDLSYYFMKKCTLKYILVQNDMVEKFTNRFSSWFHFDAFSVQKLNVTLFKVKWKETDAELLPTPMGGEAGNGSDKGDLEKLRVKNLDCSDGSVSTEYMDRRQPECLAYVLHTSGTTGLPKIVRVPHKCIVPNIQHLRRSIFEITPDDILFLASPLTFDPSVVEMFLALTTGASLLIVAPVVKMIPQKLADVLFNRHRVSVLQATPTLIRRFGAQLLRSTVLSARTSLRVLALGGEAFPSLHALRSWMETGNTTRIFNLYGITEVSSWATCYRIPESLLESTSELEFNIPLGFPLMGTTVEIRDVNHCVTDQGEGQVFIGGRERVCFLDSEVVVPLGRTRETGDWVAVKDGHVYFIGRRDSQVKRHGKRLNLEYIQQVSERLSQVEACVVTCCEQGNLILFVVPSDTYAGEDREILQELRKRLPSHAVPDQLMVVETLPFTAHGKVDLAELKKVFLTHKKVRQFDNELKGREELWESLQGLWKSLLGVAEGTLSVSQDSMFLYCGGDSLKALRLAEEINNLVGRSIPGLLEVILDDPLLGIYNHVLETMQLTKPRATIKSSKRRQGEDSGAVLHGEKIKRWKADAPSDQAGGELKSIALSRGGCMLQLTVDVVADCEFALNCDKGREDNTEVLNENVDPFHGAVTDGPSNIETSDVHQAARSRDLGEKPDLQAAGEMRVRARWRSDTGKCVDASPLLVIPGSSDLAATVFIGSHSHRIQAINLHSGRIRWERVLGDRIESSACVSKSGKLIVVGCYDGLVYVLQCSDGATHWTFPAGSSVKSSGAVDSETGLVFIGSHDQHIYALNIHLSRQEQGKKCVWKLHCGGGAVFSSPCLIASPRLLYAATLEGLLLAVNPDSGKVIWKHSCGKPVFSSPQCAQKCVFVGCVDGNFYCFSHAGEKLWQYSTSGPVFSSPCVSSFTNKVFSGSHDGFIYCFSLEGDLLWQFKTSAKVYSTPFVFHDRDLDDRPLIAVISTDGSLWILDTESGLLKASYKFPGEVFSSPVVWEKTLTVGCRNDYVYCMELSPAKQVH
uniref:Beta-alanine-activating enzyme n=1 Tax=Latimeria chalumnae TaxID=7897 RepID=H2ZXZ7_LATCH